MTADITVRREFRATDPEEIVAAHERIYPGEYGVNSEFVEMVGEAMNGVISRGFPSALEAIWIVERNGVHAGSTALTDEGEGTAMLRWVLLDPDLRGLGLMRRIIGEAVESARALGYQHVRLGTFSDLTRAAEIYLKLGFEVIEADTSPRWGRSEVTYQTYSLSLRDRAPLSTR